MTESPVVRVTRGEEGLRGLPGLIARRSNDISLAGMDETFWRVSGPLWNLLLDRYFRVESSGWERLPAAPTLVISVHAGVTLTMDAWSFVLEWWRRFGPQRVLHGTSHDVLLALPGLGALFRHAGVIPASARGITAALAAGHDVVLWPGGERDSMRAWTRRDKVELAGRKGFVRQAIRSGVPIVPVATVGGSDTAPVLFDGHWIAKKAGGPEAVAGGDAAGRRRPPVWARARSAARAHPVAGKDPLRGAGPHPLFAMRGSGWLSVERDGRDGGRLFTALGLV